MFHKRLLKEFKENRKKVAGMVFAQWGMLMANVALMLCTAYFVAAAVQGEDVRAQALLLVCVLAAALLVRGGVSALQNRLSFEASRQVKERLRTLLYEKLVRLGSGYREHIKTSEAVQISTEGVEQLEIYFGKYVPQFFYSLLAPLTLFVIVGTMSLKAAVVLLVCVPLIPVSIVAVQKFAKKMLARYWGTYTELGDSFLECLQGLTTLKIYRADERYAKKMDEEAERFRTVTMRVLIMQLNSISMMDLVAYGGAAAGMIVSLLEYRQGTITLAECFFILLVSAEFFLPLRLLGSFFHIAMNGNAAADKMFRLLDLPEEAQQEEMPETVSLSEVAFENVDFSYEAKRKVLNHASFFAKRGLTALVGESGCGKSTVVSLLMGERKPDEGKIKLGNREIGCFSQNCLNKGMTRIRHNSYLFAGTIKENLLMGKETAMEAELYAVLAKVKLDDFVKENGGLDYRLTERAANLSGGQRQRLALARALLHDSEIYIFDEATSNIDVESENAIMEVIRELAGTKVVLLISHRLANVVAADRIYVMKDGSILEEGSHEKLFAENGYYRSLYEKQRELEEYGRRLQHE